MGFEWDISDSHAMFIACNFHAMFMWFDGDYTDYWVIKHDGSLENPQFFWMPIEMGENQTLHIYKWRKLQQAMVDYQKVSKKCIEMVDLHGFISNKNASV